MYPNEPKVNSCLLPNLSIRSKPIVKMIIITPINTELNKEALVPKPAISRISGA